MEICLGNKKYEITREKVEVALSDVAPRRVMKYSICIGHRHYPIKQAISAALQISPMEFGTMPAYQILQKLGFEIFIENG